MELGKLSPSTHCDFCNEFADGTNNAFYTRYHEPPQGRALLTTENFRAILRWNQSDFFGLAVGLLSDKIAV